MILTFAEDFTSSVILDTELTGTPTSGLRYNQGVHPLVTVDNLLNMLPDQSYTFADYVAGTTYGKFSTTQLRTDIVTSGGTIYESLITANVGNTPTDSPTKWQATNIESLRLKGFINKSRDNMLSVMNLNRQLVDSQFIYNVGEDMVSLSGDYSGWAIEPRGSDYVKIVINQIALQANTDEEVSMYIVNQERLVETLTLNPDNGILAFEDVGYTIFGKGRFLFLIDSQDVLSQNAYNDALKYTGFVAYPVTGSGDTPAGAEYSESYAGNGINFNISAYLDSSQYITDNEVNFALLLRAQFEIDFLRLAVSNANTQSSRVERNLSDMDQQRVYFETTDLQSDTVARRYNRLLKKSQEQLNRTFDNELKSDSSDELKIDIGVN